MKKEEIKNAIKAAGFSQNIFADAYGIPRNTVHNWCQGVTEPAPYLWALLEKELAGIGKVDTVAWVWTEYRDAWGNGSETAYSDRWDAETSARIAWDHLNEHDKKTYREDVARFDVGLCRMTYDEDAGEWVTDGDPIVTTWDALVRL